MWVVLVRTIHRLSFVMRKVPCYVGSDFLNIDEFHKGRSAAEGVEFHGFS